MVYLPKAKTEIKLTDEYIRDLEDRLNKAFKYMDKLRHITIKDSTIENCIIKNANLIGKIDKLTVRELDVIENLKIINELRINECVIGDTFSDKLIVNASTVFNSVSEFYEPIFNRHGVFTNPIKNFVFKLLEINWDGDYEKLDGYTISISPKFSVPGEWEFFFNISPLNEPLHLHYVNTLTYEVEFDLLFRPGSGFTIIRKSPTNMQELIIKDDALNITAKNPDENIGSYIEMSLSRMLIHNTDGVGEARVELSPDKLFLHANERPVEFSNATWIKLPVRLSVPSDATKGTMYMDNNTGLIRVYDGTTWRTIAYL